MGLKKSLKKVFKSSKKSDVRTLETALAASATYAMVSLLLEAGDIEDWERRQARRELRRELRHAFARF